MTAAQNGLFDGPPGNYHYLWYEQPELRAPRREGWVTAVLARPDHIPNSTSMQDVRTLEGDSHIAICRPAVPVDTPSRNLKFETVYGDKAVTVVGDANGRGRLGKLHVTRLGYGEPYPCETLALELVNPILTNLSVENSVPMMIWQLHIGPAGQAKVFIRVTRPIPDKRHGNRQHVFPVEYAHLGAAYREGLNLVERSPLFAFLSIYKVLEGAKAIQERITAAQIDSREQQRVPAVAEQAATWIGSLLASSPAPVEAIGKWIPPEALGKKFGWVHDRLREVRNKAAHGLVDIEDPAKGVASADDPVVLVLVQKWLPLLQALAKLTLQKSGVREVPLGLPTPIALEQLKSDLGRNGASEA